MGRVQGMLLGTTGKGACLCGMATKELIVGVCALNIEEMGDYVHHRRVDSHIWLRV